MKTLYIHSDNGHAWLAVKRNRLIELGILDNISHYSYQKGMTVYLEEDCDLTLFILAEDCRSWSDLACKYNIKHSHTEHSRIRSYKAFRKG